MLIYLKLEQKTKEIIPKLYHILLDHYGAQGWWPLLRLSKSKINPTLRGKFTGYHPNNFQIPEIQQEILEIMIGAILTQNTSWVNAEKALNNLFINQKDSIESLNEINTEELANLIRSSGYYNQKAVKIRNLTKFLSQNSIKSLDQLPIINLREKLLSIKGVGPETADSMILYGFKKPIFVIDAYTKRLFGRMGLILSKESYQYFQDTFHHSLPPDVAIFNEYHALIVQHCAHICKSKPKCQICILNDRCKRIIPVKPKKKSSIKNRVSIKKKSSIRKSL